MGPDFAVPGEAGEIRWSDLRGQVVVVAFWASWCGPCQHELPALAKLSESLAAEGLPVTFLAVSTDERRADYEVYARRHDLQALTFAWSPELAVRYEVDGIPDSWIVDREGVLRYHHVGYAEGSEARIEREIRALLR